MKSLNAILSHRYLKIKPITPAVYGVLTDATYTRLLSRKRGRHRYTEEEYRKLLRYFRTLVKKLRSINFEDFVGDNGKVDYKRLKRVVPDCISLAKMAKDSKNFYNVFNQIEGKIKADKRTMKIMTRRLHKLADFIEENLELAKQEARRYNFSYGRGQHSHIT